MKKIFILVLGFILFSCKSTKKSGSTADFDLNRSINEINFTAYKTTEKVAVEGMFKDIEITKNGIGDTVKEAIDGVEFKIPVSSVETNDISRNAKIGQFFFKVMANTSYLKGKISLTDDQNGVVDFTMNDITEKLPFAYTIQNKTFEMKTVMNIDKWNAQEALKSLNDICKALHSGPDGVSKTWNEVSIHIISQF